MPATITERRSSTWQRLPIRSKGALLIALPVACLLFELLALLYVHREEEEDANAWTVHSEQVKLEAQRLLMALVDEETGMRGYAITHQQNFLDVYQQGEKAAPVSLHALQTLVSDNPQQSARLPEIANLSEQKTAMTESILRLAQEEPGRAPQSPEVLRDEVARGKQLMDTLRARIDRFVQEEDRLLQIRMGRLQRVQRLTLWLEAGGFLGGVLGGILILTLFNRNVSRQLEGLAANADRLSQGQPLAELECGDDEMGRLHEALCAAAEAISERTATLRAANSDLVASNAELEAFSYSISHDLRAPLRHMDGFSRILLEDYGPRMEPEAICYLQRVMEGARAMGCLIDELLQLGRIGRQELRMQITGLDSLLGEARRQLQPEAAERDIAWRVQALPFVECDAGLMKQVFVNLLSNAVKYTRPRAHAVIEVGSAQVQGETAIYVRDNGVGFDMKYADKLFGIFQRLHRAEDFEGTGVGLATVARIIHKHGGRIWAESELERGATFYFTLPGCHSSAAASPRPSAQEGVMA